MVVSQHTMSAYVDTFNKNFLPEPKVSQLRNIGLELEFPIVKNNGFAVDYQTILKLFAWLEEKGWKATSDTGTGEIVEMSKSITNGHGRFGFEKTVIGTDVGYCTIEVALTPHNNLFVAEECWKHIKDLLLEFFSQENCHMLGYGIQPLSPPTHDLVANKGRYKFFEQDSLNRVIDQRQGQDLSVFAISASSQCHIDVYKEEAIISVNVMNGLAPLLSALTANSPIWQGKTDDEWLDVREIFWDKSWSNRIEQVGIPEIFINDADYVDRLGQFRPLMVKRGDEYIKILHHKTFNDFLDAKESEGQTVDGKILKLISLPEDIRMQSGFAWWQARLAPEYGTLEVRPCSQQPGNATLGIAALMLGLVENLEEAQRLYAKHTLANWRKLRFDVLRHGLSATINGNSILPLIENVLQIANVGLQKRKLGEEVFLSVLEQRAHEMLTVADKVKTVFDKNNLQAFFDLVEIR